MILMMLLSKKLKSKNSSLYETALLILHGKQGVYFLMHHFLRIISEAITLAVNLQLTVFAIFL